VGSEPSVTFSVHEKLICASSDFFEKALSGKWKESKERSVKLEWDHPEAFQLYIHWLYYHTLPIRINDPGFAGNAEYVLLANAYVLGDMLQDGNFKDAIIDAIIDKSNTSALDGKNWLPVGPVISCIYDNTVQSAKARRLLVDFYVRLGSGDLLHDWSDMKEIPKEFLFDLAIELLNKRPRPSGSHPITKTCEYHEHGPLPTLCYKDRQANRPQALRK